MFEPQAERQEGPEAADQSASRLSFALQISGEHRTTGLLGLPAALHALLIVLYCIQARLLYHEAAGVVSQNSSSKNCGQDRVQLLQEASQYAARATELAPNSLSCAALRATLAINLLVEESALLTPSLSSSSSSSSGSKKPGAQPTTLEVKCQELRERFRSGLHVCRTALESPNPCMFEPVINMTTSTHTTCDPCSLVRSIGFLVGLAEGLSCDSVK